MFYGCTGITAFESESTAFTVVDGMLMDSTSLYAYPAGRTDASLTLTSGLANQLTIRKASVWRECVP